MPKRLIHPLFAASLLGLCLVANPFAEPKAFAQGTGGFGGGLGGGTGGTGGFTGGTGGTGGFGGGTGGGGTNGGIGASSQNLGSNINTSPPVSPFGSNTAGTVFGGFARTPQGFNNPIQSAGTGQAGGRTGANAANPLSQLGMGGRGGLGGMNQLGGLGNRNRMGGLGGNNQSQNQNQNKVRAVMSLGFDGPPVNSTAVNSTIQSRISRMSLPDRLKQVQVEMDGRTAIIKGTVGSESDKRMLERLLGLEPGVSKIKNELSVVKK